MALKTHTWYATSPLLVLLLPPCAEVDLRCGAYVCVQASAPKEADTNADPSRFEPPSASESLKAENNKAMVVKDLVKRFKTPDGVKTAVNHLSVTMYEDEIFALLGHNGLVFRSAVYCTGCGTPTHARSYAMR